MTSDHPAIRVSHLGKQYRLGVPQEQYLTFRDAIVNTLKAPLKAFQPAKPDEMFWALKDVSFEVQQGDIVGIIGRNGAGKSTLLKILSRITTPTEGTVELHGRVGSLLEVGTGFHPEMTGRENIFLNGSILGMKKTEIEEKFDEIVKFSEIEKFLDTPVKRYSSGMYVRLAFAVAAHLDPEILLVDEVLAVGDAQFQKKCLGKMGEVAEEGRTVLFVSHNMGAIFNFCKRGILLHNGQILIDSSVDQAVNKYQSFSKSDVNGLFYRTNDSNSKKLIMSVELLDANNQRTISFHYNDPIKIRIKTNSQFKEKFGIELRIKNSKQDLIGYSSSWIKSEGDGLFEAGSEISITIPNARFVQDTYYIDINCRIPLLYHLDAWWNAAEFDVISCLPGNSPISIQSKDQWGSVIFDEILFISGN